MKLRKLILICSGIVLFCIGLTAKDITLEGTVMPIMKTKFNIGSNGPFPGVIDQVAPQNSIVFPNIYNMNGTIAERGDTLVHLRSRYWEAEILARKGKIKVLKDIIVLNVERYNEGRKLLKSGAISLEEFQFDKASYHEYNYLLKAAEDNLKEAEIVLASHTLSAPFPALVDKVYAPGGLCSTIPAVVTVSELDPIWVEVEIPRTDARKIDYNTPVTIFPVIGDKPLGVMHGHGRLTAKGYQFVVVNQVLVEKTTEVNGKKVSIVRSCHVVWPYKLSKREMVLSVPALSIFKDKTGYFVWKAEHQKTDNPDKAIAMSFPIRKVYVEPGEIEHQMGGFFIYRSLKNSKNLSPRDLVVMDPPENLQDGDLVSYVSTNFLLMPGDKVKVVIGNLKGDK